MPYRHDPSLHAWTLARRCTKPALPEGALCALLLSSACLPDFDALSSGALGGSSGVSASLGGGGAAGTESAGGTSSGGSGMEPPPPEAGAPTNLFRNGDFETGPPFWAPVGNCSVALSPVDPRAGAACLLTSNRTMTWEGPGYTLLGVANGGETYRASVWVRADAGVYPLSLTMKHRCPDDITDGVFTPLTSTTATTTWAELSGVFVAPTCNALEFILYVEGAPPGETYCIDDTTLLKLED
jgi:hypothetical protein